MDPTAAVTPNDSWQIPLRQGVIHSRLPYTGELIWIHLDSKRSRFASRTSGISMTNISSDSSNGGLVEGEIRRLQPHLCVVLESPNVIPATYFKRYWSMVVLVVHNWSQYEDPVAHIQEIGFSWNLPLPPPPGKMAQPTPQEYGNPIGVNFVPSKQAWVLIEARVVNMGFNGRVSLNLSCLPPEDCLLKNVLVSPVQPPCHSFSVRAFSSLCLPRENVAS